MKLAIKLSGFSHVGLMGFFWRDVCSDGDELFVEANGGRELLAVSITPLWKLALCSILLSVTLVVSNVFGVTGNSEVLQPVVKWVAIDVVDNISGRNRFPVHVKHDSMGRHMIPLKGGFNGNTNPHGFFRAGLILLTSSQRERPLAPETSPFVISAEVFDRAIFPEQFPGFLFVSEARLKKFSVRQFLCRLHISDVILEFSHTAGPNTLRCGDTLTNWGVKSNHKSY